VSSRGLARCVAGGGAEALPSRCIPRPRGIDRGKPCSTTREARGGHRGM